MRARKAGRAARARARWAVSETHLVARGLLDARCGPAWEAVHTRDGQPWARREPGEQDGQAARTRPLTQQNSSLEEGALLFRRRGYQDTQGSTRLTPLLAEQRQKRQKRCVTGLRRYPPGSRLPFRVALRPRAHGHALDALRELRALRLHALHEGRRHRALHLERVERQASSGRTRSCTT